MYKNYNSYMFIRICTYKIQCHDAHYCVLSIVLVSGTNLLHSMDTEISRVDAAVVYHVLLASDG